VKTYSDFFVPEKHSHDSVGNPDFDTAYRGQNSVENTLWYGFTMGKVEFATFCRKDPNLTTLAPGTPTPDNPTFVIRDDHPQFEEFVKAITHGNRIAVSAIRGGKDNAVGNAERIVVFDLQVR